MQREDVEGIIWRVHESKAGREVRTDTMAALRALLDRAERAEAERDAAFAAGQESMRERAAEQCKWHSDRLVETIRALPIKPRPE